MRKSGSRAGHLTDKSSHAVGLIVISTDRGLCGALNVNVFKQALTAIREWQGKGVEVQLCLVGSKAVQFFRRLRLPIAAAVTHLGDRPHVASFIGTVRVMLDGYVEGRIDRLLLSRLVILVSEVKRKRAVAKASLNRAIQLAGIDAKRDDLPLARLKVG